MVNIVADVNVKVDAHVDRLLDMNLASGMPWGAAATAILGLASMVQDKKRHEEVMGYLTRIETKIDEVLERLDEVLEKLDEIAAEIIAKNREALANERYIKIKAILKIYANKAAPIDWQAAWQALYYIVETERRIYRYPEVLGFLKVLRALSQSDEQRAVLQDIADTAVRYLKKVEGLTEKKLKDTLGQIFEKANELPEFDLLLNTSEACPNEIYLMRDDATEKDWAHSYAAAYLSRLPDRLAYCQKKWIEWGFGTDAPDQFLLEPTLIIGSAGLDLEFEYRFTPSKAFEFLAKIAYDYGVRLQTFADPYDQGFVGHPEKMGAHWKNRVTADLRQGRVRVTKKYLSSVNNIVATAVNLAERWQEVHASRVVFEAFNKTGNPTRVANPT